MVEVCEPPALFYLGLSLHLHPLVNCCRLLPKMTNPESGKLGQAVPPFARFYPSFSLHLQTLLDCNKSLLKMTVHEPRQVKSFFCRLLNFVQTGRGVFVPW